MTRLGRALSKLWRSDRDELFKDLQPVLEVRGRLELGDGVVLALGPIQTQIAVGHDGVCELGDRVYIGYGSQLSCEREVTIGAGSRLGAFAVIYDSDFHTAGNHDLRDGEVDEAPPKSGPVSIGERVMIAEGVTILRGTTIGDGAVIDAGSVLWGSIGPGERVSGRPRKSTS